MWCQSNGGEKGKVFLIALVFILFFSFAEARILSQGGETITDPITGVTLIRPVEEIGNPFVSYLRLDSDLDGVPDYRDRCPDTLVWEKVNRYGCDLKTFCNDLGCGLGCLEADWNNDSEKRIEGSDCALLMNHQNGLVLQPKCVPRYCDDPKTIPIPKEAIDLWMSLSQRSYVSVNLTNVPGGFAQINNTVYDGWCVDFEGGIDISFLYEAVLLSSYDPELNEKCPKCAGKEWDKINYIINHKPVGVHWLKIQEAIWHFTDEYNTSDPIVNQIINEANTYGDGYKPGKGQFVALIVYVKNNPGAQLIIIEVDP